ncbi:hypothetical protein H0H92_002102 [Tricholoma furcatifolium]|nr:hypothetical protein H0H92_002102 [Tricholoma furcatifolium]
MASTVRPLPKSHICPPSEATHPSGRWEILFVYSFICKFTNLRNKIDGLESPMECAPSSSYYSGSFADVSFWDLACFSLEEALLLQEPNEILSQVLQNFILNLKPQTRNLSKDQVASTVASVLADYFKTSERTIFWNDDLQRNVDPFESLEGGFFTASWDFKLKILRQLVELQLCHNADIKAMIDRAWGVAHSKHKKKDAATAPPEPSDPQSRQQLQLVPIGQDTKRTRYWVGDDSPRIFISTNPWKTTATFRTISTTREEYLAVIEELKASKPLPLKRGERRTRLETAHLQLISIFEDRIPAIDEELESDADEYTYQEEVQDDEEFDEEDFLNFRDAASASHKRRVAVPVGERRRSTRTSASAKINDNGKRESSADSWSHWRGERRSSRLAPEANFDHPPEKRARTEDSTMSANSAEATSASTSGAPQNGLRLKNSGAAALKPNEVALEQIAGKKKSKFWVYAVEPAPDPPQAMEDVILDGPATTQTNGHAAQEENGVHGDSLSHRFDNGTQGEFATTLEGSLSPLNSRLPIARLFATHTAFPTIPASPDDVALVSLFDHPSSSFKRSPLSNTGLFGHPSLTSPEGLISLANATLVRAQVLTDRILRARESRDELLKVVKNLDRLSDMLCGVIDLSELVRNAHTDASWLQAANYAYETLCEFMNVLNTHVGLYEVLKAVMTDPSVVSTLSPEAYKTALIFWLDFEKSAIDLPEAQRQKFVSLSSDILVLGREFLQQTDSERAPASINPSELSGLKDAGMGVKMQLKAQFSQRDLLVYPGSYQAHMIMRSAPSEEPRRRMYIASNSSTPEQIRTLEDLLRTRAELANLVGRESYAAMTLDDKMAKTPGESTNVLSFLDALMAHTRPFAQNALQTLQTRKQAHQGTSTLPTIQAWDRDFYCPPEPPAPPIPLPPLSLGTVFMGLSRLFQHLYGISLRPAESASGEVWHADVQKLEVVDEEKGVIGWIYADLFARRGKPSGAAHYTVRCSRRTDDDDEAGDRVPEGYEHQILESQQFEAVKRHRLPGQDGVYQLPVVVLLCEFARPSIIRGPTVLEWHEVTTLFHEMGHAMHSMIGRTEYHNVSGTRCATDFVELPSILMEHFLNSVTVLSLFNSEGTTAERQVGNHHTDPCGSLDTYSQILLAAIDQIYHSPVVQSPNFDSTAELANLHNTRGLIPYVPGTSFQTQFGHLFGYGATYYSYLFDRAIASRVWQKVFSADPLNRETGEKYKREVLRYGGGKDPWKMTSTLLSAPELEDGDAGAMREVGRWRIEDEVGLTGRH